MGLKAAAGSGNLFRGISGLFGAVFRVWGVISITAVIILLSSVGAIQQSFEEGSITPFIKRMGGELLNHDNALFAHASNIENAGGLVVDVAGEPTGFFAWFNYIWAVLKSLVKIVINLWYLWVFGFLMYKFAMFLTNNSSAIASNVALAVGFLVVLQIVTNFVIIDQGLVTIDSQDLSIPNKEKIIPFRGLFKVIEVAPLIFNPIYSGTTEMIVPDNFIDVSGG